jgi:hypothetical protein
MSNFLRGFLFFVENYIIKENTTAKLDKRRGECTYQILIEL